MTSEELELKRAAAAAAALAALRAQRDAAGQRYAAALSELHDAMISLASLDLAIANSNVGGEVLRSFSQLADNLVAVSHPQFAPAPPAPNLVDDVNEQAGKLIATFRRETEVVQ